MAADSDFAPAATDFAWQADTDAQAGGAAVTIPAYLQKNYWWAYVHPNAVRLFERQWLVNLILWGNFARLRDAAIDALGAAPAGRVLQIACVYGDFSTRLAARLGSASKLEVVDVLPIQLANLQQKLPQDSGVRCHLRDASNLQFDDASYDQVVLFFLLHEQPEAVRRATLAEALRVTRPGGRIVIVDYHQPRHLHPLRYLFGPLLHWLEPFALDLWRSEIASWLPPSLKPAQIHKRIFFGGLYQQLVITR